MKKTMRHGIIKGVFLLSCMALFLGVLPAGAATGNTWTGSGPFATGTGNRVINALAVSPDGLTVYAGTGSGTVFQYAMTTHILDVTVDGSGSGTVTSSPSGIDCGGTCSAAYGENTVVALSEAAGTGSTFTGWSGDCSGTDSQTDVTMDAAKSCTATFTLNQHTLTVNTAGTGSGTVGGEGTYDYNSTNQITATASAGSSFTGWSGDCTGTTSPLSITMLDRDMTCTATFTLNAVTYTVTPSAGTGGTISPKTPQTVNYDGTTSFTVTPNTGYSIASVTGCGGTLSGNTYTTGPITANCTVSATFATHVCTANPVPGVSLVLQDCISGSAAATKVSQAGPANFSIVGEQAYDITFSGGFSTAEVCIAYNDSDVHGNENNLKLMHLEGTGWTDITTSVDTVNNVICGQTTSFSDFAVLEPSGTGGGAPPALVGYSPAWLIVTFVSLMLIGAYLVRRKLRI